ncbi:hypothetical protein ACS0TY_008991 [Phlomoides rotata]
MESCSRVYDDSQVLKSLWCPNSPPSLLGSVKFDDNGDENSKVGPFKVENCSEEYDDSFHQPEKKRRLRSDQVQFLEKSFEIDNKLEPDRKTLLAKQVGLQPRQVAIWFQNRRARYKTKLLERDYDSLKSEYDKLKADYDSLFTDNDNLKNEVHLLRQKLLEGKLGSPLGRVVSSSGRSDIFDSDSPYSAPADSDPSEVSQDEDKKSCFPKNEDGGGFTKKSCLPKLEDECYDDLQPNSGNFGFPVQDQGTWFWQY